jgi:hypothetical protein
VSNLFFLHVKKENTLIFYKIICIKKYSLAYNDNVEGWRRWN